MREIDQLLLKEAYQPVDLEYPDVGYIFCPEHRSGRPDILYTNGGESARLWLFGPSLLPDERAVSIETTHAGQEAPEPIVEDLPEASAEADEVQVNNENPDGISARLGNPVTVNALEKSTEPPPSGDVPVDVLLGGAMSGADDVVWRVSIRANPHLMMVGLPGMGKTTALINICNQLATAGITPIVFSYHDDIDIKLSESSGKSEPG